MISKITVWLYSIFRDNIYCVIGDFDFVTDKK